MATRFVIESVETRSGLERILENSRNTRYRDILETILHSIKEVKVCIGKTTLNKNQCAYLSGALQAAERVVRSCGAHRTLLHPSEAPTTALYKLESVVRRTKYLVCECQWCDSPAWPERAVTVFDIKYDVLDILIHLQWWMSVLTMVLIPSSKLSEVERVQLLNEEFELKLKSFDELELAAQKDKRKLLDMVVSHLKDVYIDPRQSPDSATLLSSQVYALLTDQEEHSNPNLNDYKPGKIVGHGSFGVAQEVTWCGVDCVLKTCNDWKADDVEVKSLKSLRHPHIVRYLRHWNTNDKSHILMEKMEKDLFDHISAEQRRSKLTTPFSLAVAIDIMLQVINAVCHMHDNCFVHRDLKPKNVLVRQYKDFSEDGYVEVKLGDFGIAKAGMMTSNAGVLTFKAGTSIYRAPELSSKEYTEGARNFPRRIDMWSFGIICSEILTGQQPFSGYAGNALLEHIRKGGRPSLPDDCPDYLKYCIESCWQLKPEDRPRAADVWRMLRIAQLRILGLVGEKCDSLFRYQVRSNAQASEIITSYWNNMPRRVHERIPTSSEAEP